ncbi:uncharacterized protein PITG_00389 [Phytophthora infestans T30-4]|uniref:Uncharacterized protein n=1 Tax=Phytophthora infestans (strain T30-4) TaxID=403677 RepID=D0MQN7_PHYIT|nr:uncharacterized protein PITG_00389 [Phytophthora infestans T30-4]EEY57806.1 conserved hypothetical protein [Phytophthora infestans T30-4]|eukprot:XP_002908992.1 conserved hypothetical protein [Phytophthora infestans T30-4]
MGSETQASAGSGCLRSSPMNAVMGHLKSSLRTYSLHAVDCVFEPMDVESSTIALMGIASLCSRSNMDVEEDMDTWGREAKRQVDQLFETEKRISLDQTTGMVRHVPISPAYELPTSGSGLPQFILGETVIWSDNEGEKQEAKDQSFFTHVQLHVKNDGKTPLHLYRLTLVEKSQEPVEQGFVLPLVAPAVVQPDTSEVVSFKAITGAAVDASKSYLLYISHSGFRSHVFEVGSMAIAVAVGLAVTLYIRRKRPSVRLMGHVATSCLRSPSKTGGTGGRTSAKPISNRVASSRAAISERGEDHIEMERMPAITMKWRAPPPPIQSSDTGTNKTSLAIPRALETHKLLLDLDRKARLHPKRFESMWDEYVERANYLTPTDQTPTRY